jgi:tetratricopeptide (TPR) repeat protein
MSYRRRLGVLTAVILLAATASSCTFYNKLKARDQLNKGVTAFQNKDYARAEQYFINAKDLDPELLHAWLYLATTYRMQVPPVKTPEGVAMAKKAIVAYEDVLKVPSKSDDAQSLKENAMASIAGLYIEPLGDRDMAREWQRKRMEADPKNPEPLYGVGTLDWQEVYDKTGQTGEQVDKLSAEEKAALNAKVDDGIQALNEALKINPNYVDAMQYQNLLYREKAKLTKDPEEKKQYLNEANLLALKAIATKRKLDEQTEKERRMLKTSEN